jgi:hypothetical protein
MESELEVERCQRALDRSITPNRHRTRNERCVEVTRGRLATLVARRVDFPTLAPAQGVPL